MMAAIRALPSRYLPIVTAANGDTSFGRFAYPGRPGEVQLLWWEALGRGHQAPHGPENARFQRRLLVPSVFGEGGEPARITEAEAR
jgi:hypothetical protein